MHSCNALGPLLDYDWAVTEYTKLPGVLDMELRITSKTRSKGLMSCIYDFMNNEYAFLKTVGL